jgi:hypothetical protein
MVCTIPWSRLDEAQILGFLNDARFPVNLVEVSLFKEGVLYRPEKRCWEPAGDLPVTAKDISRYIADNGSADVRIVASDEVYCFDPNRRLMSPSPIRWA